jgi:uncharacterized sporulation protein YeaH/YhbH (DUF444 family)
MTQSGAERRRKSTLPWELRHRGLKDSLRHDQRVKDAIRKNLRELIAEEAIITSDGTRRVKIPLRYLDQYHFKYGQPPQGVGQGEGQPGEVLGQRSSDGNSPGAAHGSLPRRFGEGEQAVFVGGFGPKTLALFLQQSPEGSL